MFTNWLCQATVLILTVVALDILSTLYYIQAQPCTGRLQSLAQVGCIIYALIEEQPGVSC